MRGLSALMHPPPYDEWKDEDHFTESENHVVRWCCILDHLARTIGRADEEYLDAGSDNGFEAHLPTYKKLLLASSYVLNTLSIARNHAGPVYYLDVLSASGLSSVSGTDFNVPGSCFSLPLACQDWDNPGQPPEYTFDKVWTFDKSAENLSAILDRRKGLTDGMGLHLPPFGTRAGNANEELSVVLDAIREETVQRRNQYEDLPLTYAFIDNEGMDIVMETVREIQQKIRADLIIHVPVRGVIRTIRQHEEMENSAERLTEFFGDESWREIEEPAQVPAVYRDKVEEVTEHAFQEIEPVRITSEKNEFALLFCARKTSGIGEGQEGWVGKIKPLARGCNEIERGRLKDAIQQGIGTQQSLSDF